MTVETVEIPGYVAGDWILDPAHTDVGFKIRHMMLNKVRGQFTGVEGRIVTAENPLESTVTATIDLATIDTGNAQRDEHVRSADFLDVATYPTMTYRSTGLRPDGDAFLLDGELTLRGITKEVPLRLEIGGFGPDPFRQDDPFKGARAGFTATGELDRTDFGVGDTATIPGGALGLGLKLQLILEIQAVLQTD
ncbi:YceI family protein [Actinomadura rudentiformis]|uniref:YceI family protein n=1 Tax=Actinomadura rudentiformis TaxID=359158 RepID=A0A6H9YDX6_9ACTN|nr:YceI family protein [Actinomadura rudentiformis]KAB2339344.1 YceI family protein [Actinomadura rudentiformis]